MRPRTLALVLTTLGAAVTAQAAPATGKSTGKPAAHAAPPTVARIEGGSLLCPPDLEPDAAAVRREVKQKGFYAGPPIGSAACESCHADVAAQWAGSAHRFSSFNNPYYRVSVDDFRGEKGRFASRFCAGCHEPALLRAGGTGTFPAGASPVDGELDPARLEAQAGVGCLLCHSIDSTHREGNGSYHASVDPIPSGKAREAHKARVRRAALGTAELCGACHKVGLSAEVTADRWIRGQDDYDPWQTSAVSGHGAASVWRPENGATKRCQDCHMPLEPATLGDAGAHDGKIRSHRFLGANAALPHLRGDAEQEQRTIAFLQGAVTLDAFWHESREADILLRARRIGHRFPSGTMDSNEVWLEVTALDAAGRVLGRSGALDEARRLSAEAHLVRAQPVDGDAMPLSRRDPQHMRGVAYDTSLAPSDPQAVRYAVPAGTAKVVARLLYRKFTRDYVERACQAVPDAATRARCLDVPVVELARTELAAGTSPLAESDWKRLVDRGLALGAALADCASDALPFLERARALAPTRPEPILGLSRVLATLGRTDEAVARAAEAATLDPTHPAAPWLAASTLERAYRQAEALPWSDKLLALLPDDRNALALASRVRGVTGDAHGALTAADALIAVDPQLDEGWYQRSLALGELGRARESDAARDRYLSFRIASEIDLALRDRLRQRREAIGLPDEALPVHTHTLTPPPK